MTDPEILETLLEAASNTPVQQLPRLLGRLAEATATAQARLLSPGPAPQADELLGIAEASQRLNVSESYLYRHSSQLPFTVRQGRKLLFSTAGITKYISKNQNGG